MNISCEIIKDLLPLYLDDVCSDESKAAVDEHMTACGNCKSELLNMQTSLPITRAEQNINEAEAVIKLSQKWKEGMKKALLKGIFITMTTMAVIGVIAIILYIFVDIHVY